MFNQIPGMPALPFDPAILALLVLWDLFWRAVGLWYAIKNNSRNWFVAIFVISSLGILPILYLFAFGGLKKK